MRPRPEKKEPEDEDMGAAKDENEDMDGIWDF